MKIQRIVVRYVSSLLREAGKARGKEGVEASDPKPLSFTQHRLQGNVSQVSAPFTSQSLESRRRGRDLSNYQPRAASGQLIG